MVGLPYQIVWEVLALRMKARFWSTHSLHFNSSCLTFAAWGGHLHLVNGRAGLLHPGLNQSWAEINIHPCSLSVDPQCSRLEHAEWPTKISSTVHTKPMSLDGTVSQVYPQGIHWPSFQQMALGGELTIIQLMPTALAKVGRKHGPFQKLQTAGMAPSTSPASWVAKHNLSGQ